MLYSIAHTFSQVIKYNFAFITAKSERTDAIVPRILSALRLHNARLPPNQTCLFYLSREIEFQFLAIAFASS